MTRDAGADTTTDVERPPRMSARRLLLLALAAVLWVAAYRTNLRWWDWAVYDAAGFDPDTRLGGAVHFFLYDTAKIALLLTGVIFVVTIARSFMSVERTRALLGGRREGVGNVVAAGLGIVTPFCSCSAVPAFIGFVAAGVPLGVTLSFLIASPLVNEIAIVLLLGLFGWQITLLYVAGGATIAIVAGYVLGRLHLEKWVEPFVFETRLHGQPIDPSVGLTWDDRIDMGIEEVRTILVKIWPYLLVGIGLGAAIHGWVPDQWIADHATSGLWGVIVAVGLGVPLYSNAAGILPLVETLHDKGLPMGTVLAFMMSVVALSMPEMVLLRRVLKKPLIATYVAVVATGILAIGYLFNLVL